MHSNKHVTLWVLGLVTFTFIFLFHTFPLGLSDFWWHLNTGRWIWVHGRIPVDDPFLFSSPIPLDARAELILRGYPLSQLVELGIYHLGGTYALVLLKGLLMTLFYLLLWNNLRCKGLHPLLSMAIVALLPLMFFRFDELRPQIFSFIGTLLLIQLVEYILAKERRGELLKLNVLASLPFIMFIWANLHRGFIIGVGILWLYLASEWFAKRRGNGGLSDRGLERFLILVVVASASAFINPVGGTAFWASFTEIAGPFSKVVDEFLGTVRYFSFHGMKAYGYVVVGAAAIPFAALLFKWRQVHVVHFVLGAAFLVAGIMSFRFSLMMVSVLLVIASEYYAVILNRWLGIGKRFPMILLWCLTTGLMANSAIGRTSIMSSPLENAVIPTAAVEYLESSGISGNLYNYFEYGGYLSWRLYPRKIFIDQRNLSWDVYEEYSKSWRGDYVDVFNKYKVVAVLYPVYDMASGLPSRLVGGLLRDNGWEVGYYDGHDIIFIRHDVENGFPALSKQKVINEIINHLRAKQ